MRSRCAGVEVLHGRAHRHLRVGGAPQRRQPRSGARVQRSPLGLAEEPGNLTDDQADTLRKLKRRGGDVWRAYTLKEAFRAIFAGDLDTDAVAELIDRWISRASRSRLPAFVKTAKTIRKHRDGILAAIRLGINNARRGPQLRRTPHHPTCPRLPQRRRGPRSGHARLRTTRPSTTLRALKQSTRMTHTHAGSAPIHALSSLWRDTSPQWTAAVCRSASVTSRSVAVVFCPSRHIAGYRSLRRFVGALRGVSGGSAAPLVPVHHGGQRRLDHERDGQRRRLSRHRRAT
ncbi:MAG: transposase, partial [Micromonosporaceae bacterium]